MIGMPTIQLSAGLSRMASGSSQRQRGLQPYGFDGRGKRADKRGDDGRTGRNHRRRIWVCGRFQRRVGGHHPRNCPDQHRGDEHRGEGDDEAEQHGRADDLYGYAGSGRAQCAADEQLVRALLDAGQSDVDHADGGYRQQQYRGDGDAELEKTDDLLVIIGVVGTVP